MSQGYVPARARSLLRFPISPLAHLDNQHRLPWACICCLDEGQSRTALEERDVYWLSLGWLGTKWITSTCLHSTSKPWPIHISPLPTLSFLPYMFTTTGSILRKDSQTGHKSTQVATHRSRVLSLGKTLVRRPSVSFGTTLTTSCRRCGLLMRVSRRLAKVGSERCQIKYFDYHSSSRSLDGWVLGQICLGDLLSASTPG